MTTSNPDFTAFLQDEPGERQGEVVGLGLGLGLGLEPGQGEGDGWGNIAVDGDGAEFGPGSGLGFGNDISLFSGQLVGMSGGDEGIFQV